MKNGVGWDWCGFDEREMRVQAVATASAKVPGQEWPTTVVVVAAAAAAAAVQWGWAGPGEVAGPGLRAALGLASGGCLMDTGKVDTPNFTRPGRSLGRTGWCEAFLGHQCPSGLGEDGRWCLSMWGAERSEQDRANG